VGIFSPNMVTHRSNPQKDHPCAETRRLGHPMKRENRSNGSTWAQDREKKYIGRDRTGQSKSHKVVIFRLFGKKPPLYRLTSKFAWRVTSLALITYAKFPDDIFMGYNFTGGRISPPGALGVLVVHLQIFPVNYAYNFFSALGVQMHPLHPLATPMRVRR